MSNQENFVPVNIKTTDINENVKLFKYIVRFGISYQLLLIVIAIVFSVLSFDDGNIGSSFGAIIGAVSFTVSKFVKDNQRVPNDVEKKKLIWFSFFATWFVPLMVVSPFFLYSYGLTYFIAELKEIDVVWFLLIILVFAIGTFFIIQHFYGSMAKEYFKLMQKKQPAQKKWIYKKKVWIPLSMVLLVAFFVVSNKIKNNEEYDLKISDHQKVLKHKLTTLKENDLSIAETYSDLGDVYIKKQEYDVALKNYEKALNINLMTSNENDYSSIYYYRDIAYSYHLKGQYKKSLKYYEKSIKIQSNRYGEDFLGVGIVYKYIGDVYFSKGYYDTALKYQEKALKIILNENKNGDFDNSESIAYSALVDTYLYQYEFSKAFSYAKKYYNIKYK